MTRNKAALTLSELLNIDLQTAQRILDFIEDSENGLGMYPPMNKKGKFEWDQEMNSSN